MPIKIVGHRGLGPTSSFTQGPNGYMPDNLKAENSLTSLKECIHTGGDGIEIDVCSTKDGVPLVIHNNGLNKNVFRANRDSHELGFISDKSFAECMAQDSQGNYKYPIGPNNEKIPTLEEVLDWVVEENQTRQSIGQDPILLDIELKRWGSAKAAYHLIQKYIQSGKLNNKDIIYCSFKYQQLHTLHQLDIEHNTNSNSAITIHTGLLYGYENESEKGIPVKPDIPYQQSGLEELQKLVSRYQLGALDAEHNDVEWPLLEMARKNRIDIHCWPTDFGDRAPSQVFLQNMFKLEADYKLLMIKTDTPCSVKNQLLYFQKHLKDLDLSQVKPKTIKVLEQGAVKDLSKLTFDSGLNGNFVFYSLKAQTPQIKDINIIGVLDEEHFKQLEHALNQKITYNFDPHRKNLIYMMNQAELEPNIQQEAIAYFIKHYSG